MDLKAPFFATVILTVLLSPPSLAQSPPTPILPPSSAPVPAPAPHYANLTYLFLYAGPYHTFLNYLQQTKVIDTFQAQANDTKQGITIFVPKDAAFSSLKKADLTNLTDDQIKTLLLYHAFPHYYSLSDFKYAENPLSTYAGGQNTLNITYSNGVIHIGSSWSKPKLISSVYSTGKVGVYEVDRVLLPRQLFRTDPPLAPVPAPSPEPVKASDLAPSKGGKSSGSESSESESSRGFRGGNVGLLSSFVLVALMVLL